MNITALQRDYREKSGEQNHDINIFVADGLLYIIQHYFAQWSSFFVLTLSCRSNHTCNFYNDMFHKMFAKWDEWPLQIVVARRNFYAKVPGLRQNNLIFTDSYEAFEDTEIHTYTDEYNTNENYFIFLQCRDYMIPRELKKILEYCWRHYLINCVVQIQTAKGKVLHYSYYPFTAKHCGGVEPVIVNEYNGTSLIYEDLFPKKLKNFYGCPLKAALWHVPPYIYLSTDSNNTMYVSGGFEGKLLLELASKLNFSLDIIVPQNDSKRGLVLENGTLTGALKMLHEREAHLSCGSIRQTLERGRVATSSINYFTTPWSLVTMSEAYLLTSLQIILFPYSTNTWFTLGIVITLAFSLAFVSKKFFRRKLCKKCNDITLDILLMLLGMPAQYKPTNNSSRILKASWMCFTLILRTIYQALLFHLIRTHITQKVPGTLEELLEKNYTMLVNLPTFYTFKEILLFEYLHFKVLNTSSDLYPLEYLESLPLAKSKHMAVAVPFVFLQYYSQSRNKSDVFKQFPKSVMPLTL